MTTPKPKTVTLVAIKIPRYAGKALRSGDTFEAAPKDAKVLTAAKLATYGTRDQARAPMRRLEAPALESVVTTDAIPPSDELSVLRDDYEIIAGKKALGFWKADKIRAELEKMRADRDVSGISYEPRNDE
jgi:hypothetical protein